MTHTRLAIVFATLALATIAACGATPPVAPASSAAPAPSAPAAPVAAVAPDAGTMTGTVAETMNSGGYTYVRLQTPRQDVWIAADEFPVKTGERLTAAINMPMENFTSKTLNRTFPLIYFVTGVAREGESLPTASAVPALAGSHDSAAAPAAAQVVEPIAPAPGGRSIADVWANRKALAGKVVVVRGKVVKAIPEVMGKNWFHLQDGSGSAKDGTNDLTITTSATVKVGDIVTVSGTLAVDKDFGSGYAYEVIVENATVTASKSAGLRLGSEGMQGVDTARETPERASQQAPLVAVR
ncbi:MAG: hypothetical protein WC815_12590 [Vicinamibacterales bacterium]